MTFTVTLTPTGSAIPSELVNVIKGDPAGGGGGGATNLAYTASPTGGTVTSDTGTDATLTLADATNAGLMAPAQHSKLAGIASGATANATDAQLRDRGTHTGTQTASTISDFTSAASAAAPVQSVAGRTGTVTIAAADITDSTTAGRAVLTAADAAAQRTALGLGAAATAATTDGVTEGSTNLYHTAARVRAAVLTGLSTATNAVIDAADTVLGALGKLQAQITENLATLTGHTGNTSNPHSVTAAQVGAAASGAVTGSGLTMATARLLGRSTASTGAVEEISIGSNLTLSGGTLSASGGGSPAGSAGQVQYTDGSAFAAAPLWVSANTVEQYNGASAQVSYIYNTRTNGSNYERGFVRWASNVCEFGAEGAGTGSNMRTVRLTTWNGASKLDLGPYQAIFQVYDQYLWGTVNTGPDIRRFGVSHVIGCNASGTRADLTIRPATGNSWETTAGNHTYISGGRAGEAGNGHGGHVKLAGGLAGGTGTKGRVILDAPNAAPQDSFLANGEVTFYLDQSANKLMARVKYSDGTLKTGEVALT